MPTTNRMLGLFTSPLLQRHVLAPGTPDRPNGHPERPARLQALLAACQTAGLIEQSPLPPLEVTVDVPVLAPADAFDTTPEPAGDEMLLLIHPPAHLERVARLAATGGYADGGDTYLSTHSDDAARRAVTCVARSVDFALAGGSRCGIALVRPPGHHAEPNRAMGFCLYANAAIAAQHAMSVHGVERVAMIDFDVHHGNGTQTCFYSDPNVLTVSLHQSPQSLWPGTGFASETGAGPGEGACLNVPIDPGTTVDAYLDAFAEQVIPAVTAFRPQLLIAVAGFDAHRADPLASLALTTQGFARIGREIAALADACCDGRLVVTLEGGYDLQALAESFIAFVEPLQHS